MTAILNGMSISQQVYYHIVFERSIRRLTGFLYHVILETNGETLYILCGHVRVQDIFLIEQEGRAPTGILLKL